MPYCAFYIYTILNNKRFYTILTMRENTMTVKQLKEELSKYPEELEIVIEDFELSGVYEYFCKCELIPFYSNIEAAEFALNGKCLIINSTLLNEEQK